MSPNLIVQLIERLAFSLAELFIIDKITFSSQNKKLFENNISLYDIPLLKKGFYHRHFDDDLIKIKKTEIIKNGEIKNLLNRLDFGFYNFEESFYNNHYNGVRQVYTNLYLKIPKIQRNVRFDYFLEDSLLPLKIDLFTGDIKGKVIGVNMKDNRRIIGLLETNYYTIFNSIRRVGKYLKYQGHKISFASAIIKEGGDIR